MLPVMTAGSKGKAVAFPDVCKTPVPGGPPAPTPYSDTAMTSDGQEGAATHVDADGDPVLPKTARIATSTGDEAGSVGGVKSGTTKGKAEAREGAPDVSVEGKQVALHTQKVDQNDGNAPLGAWLVPSQSKVLVFLRQQKKKPQNPILSELQQLIDCSKTLQRQVEKMGKQGWHVGWADTKDGALGFCDFDNKAIWLSSSIRGTFSTMCAVLAHEAGHFDSGDAEVFDKSMDQTSYRDQNTAACLKSEGEAAYNNCQVAAEASKCGIHVPILAPPPLTSSDILDAYNGPGSRKKKVSAMAQLWTEKTTYPPGLRRDFNERWLKKIAPKIQASGAEAVEKGFKRFGRSLFLK